MPSRRFQAGVLRLKDLHEWVQHTSDVMEGSVLLDALMELVITRRPGRWAAEEFIILMARIAIIAPHEALGDTAYGILAQEPLPGGDRVRGSRSRNAVHTGVAATAAAAAAAFARCESQSVCVNDILLGCGCRQCLLSPSRLRSMCTPGLAACRHRTRHAEQLPCCCMAVTVHCIRSASLCGHRGT